jgi:Flp pilus assembly protein CpaB
MNAKKSNGISWSPNRLKRAAAGLVVAAVAAVGIGAASGGAGAVTGWGRAAPTTVPTTKVVVTATGVPVPNLSAASTGWGAS